MLKKTAGKQKIEIKKIENTQALNVAFSRRRKSVFKKASELSTLCGAQTAVVVFSPGDRPFSFGQPSVGAVVDRYLNNNNPPQDFSTFDASRDARIQKLNQQVDMMLDRLEVEAKRCDELKDLKEQSKKQCGLPSEEEDSYLLEFGKKIAGMKTTMANRNEFTGLFRSSLPSSMSSLDGLVGASVQSVANRSTKPMIGYSSSAVATNPLEFVSPSDPYEITRSPELMIESPPVDASRIPRGYLISSDPNSINDEPQSELISLSINSESNERI
ncbi:Agamous-like mads-box protein [Thalictrum thalictroides]|uniref:Agamous-like mads-box protein n=1 Tax=Thalictrum thalictroides TaxID=46969 RepID=A0A7J6V239_THATH|nr:Agamous-like mads-box protein [Thalictrum thalictroides]